MNLDIIIPIYNCENNIGDLLKELCNQNIYNDSIILIDDGSTDNSYNICKYYADKYINVKLIHQDNKGPAIARNHGIKNGNNEFIWFIDSDDRIKDNALKIIHSYLKKNIDMICFGMTNVGFKNNVEIYRNEFTFKKNLYQVNLDEVFNELIDKSLFNSLCNKIFKREFLTRNKLFLDKVNLIEDVSYVIKVMNYCPKITVISDNLYIYYSIIENKNTVSSKYYPDKFDRYLELDDKFNKLIDKYHLPEDSSKRVNNILLRNIYSVLIEEYGYALKNNYFANYDNIIGILKNKTIFRKKIKNSKGITFTLKVFRLIYLYFPISFINFFIKTRLKIKSV